MCKNDIGDVDEDVGHWRHVFVCTRVTCGDVDARNRKELGAVIVYVVREPMRGHAGLGASVRVSVP